MRLIAFVLASLLILIQFPLWTGKGGWLRAWELEKQVNQAQKKNEELRARNAKLESEVLDLKQGTGAVEERARYELGMIREDEVFVQVLDTNEKLDTLSPVTAPEGALPPPKPKSTAQRRP